MKDLDPVGLTKGWSPLARGISRLIKSFTARRIFFPKQLRVGILNAFLVVSTLSRMLCPPRPACVSLVSGLVSHVVFQLLWDVFSPFLGLSPSLSPALSSSWSGMLCLLGILSSSWSGMLRPPPWACLPACLPSCLPAGLGCCVPLPALVSHLVFQLVWDAAPPSLGLSPSLSPILYPILSSSWSGMLRPPPPSLVLSPILSSSWSETLCLPPWACLPSFLPLRGKLVVF